MFNFGTSGIRDLTENLLKDKIATKLAKTLNKMGWDAVTIARDGRKGSDKLMAEFVANFKGYIHNLGVTTTPELATHQGLAVMITASHNPVEYCGFKVYVNHKEQCTAEVKPTPVYNKWDLLPHDITIDCANGGMGNKLKSLGFTNIINYQGATNKNCGATHPENITKYCQENHQEIGFAVDGDGDRFLMYLGDRVLNSDELAYLICKLTGLKSLVIDETNNSALCNYFNVVFSAVGGHNLLAAMQKNNITFGAEKSGHYYFDKDLGDSDAADAIILLSNAYHQYGVTGLQKIVAKYKPYYQFNQNIRLENLPADYQSVLDNFTLPKGVRKVIRKSGTEPLLRIMLEGKNAAAVDKVWEGLKKQLKIK